jgi:hypothetical protein
LINLGMIESLVNGSVTASDALRIFFNADNCLFVRKQLQGPAPGAVVRVGVGLTTHELALT